VSGRGDGNGAVRIAMWSGPRNISTALMRAWGSRADTVVCDEPLYAHYLQATGRPHPGAAEVIAHHDTDWQSVVRDLLGPLPPGKSIFYQKHMAHHLLPGVGRDWIDGLTNCFLIRSPREMLSSLAKVLEAPGLEETGLPQQVSLFERVRTRTGEIPPVIDARDVLTDPPGLLRKLCEAIGVPYLEAMLHWEPGPRDSDGIWGPHWYEAAWRSTGFAPYRPKNEPVPAHLCDLLADCEGLYRVLHAHRIT
jgi:hypothetical protein